MNKTPIRARFVKQLVGVNDQLCFAALARLEFKQALVALVQGSPKLFTPEVFPSNPYADRLYRRLEEMPDFAVESEQIELKMSVIAGVEFALAYLSEVEAYRKQVAPSPADNAGEEAAEERVLVKLTQWSGREPDKGPYRTLGYLRHLRNHYAHLNEGVIGAFSSYVANYAHYLQRYWDNGRTEIGDIEFRTLMLNELKPESAFGVMNLLRVSIEKIDRDFAATLTFEDVAGPVVADAFELAAHHDRTAERLARRVRSTLQAQFGERFDEAQILAAVEHHLNERKKTKRQ